MRRRAHDLLKDTIDVCIEQPLIIAGDEAGCGVTRTMDEFSLLLPQMRMIQNSAAERQVAILDFSAVGRQELPLILVELRNQLIEFANQCGYKSSHKFFKDFDFLLGGWLVTYYLPASVSDAEPELSRSVYQKIRKRILLTVPKLLIGATTANLIDSDEIADLVLAMLQEGADAASSTTYEALATKWAEEIEKIARKRSARTRRHILSHGRLNERFEGGLTALFTDALDDYQQKLSSKIRVFVNLDSLDEYEPQRQFENNVRAQLCGIMANLKLAQIGFALGSRGQPKNWIQDLQPLEFQMEALGLISREEVERSWAVSKQSNSRVEAAMNIAFPESKEQILAAELAEAWIASESTG